MRDKKVLIWGAGKIGRGFIAPLFIDSGYTVFFLDSSEKLLKSLSDAGRYPVRMISTNGEVKSFEVSGYETLSFSYLKKEGASNGSGNGKDNFNPILTFNLIVVSVPVFALRDVAFRLSEVLKIRALKNGAGDGNRVLSPLDIILCTNILHPAESFRDYLVEGLMDVGLVSTKEEALSFIEKNVGIVESLVIRMAPTPSEELLKENPLYVVTDNYPELPVDGNAFKNGIPPVAGLRVVSNMRAEETRKLYTYNLAHAVLAYVGSVYGYSLIADVADDAIVRGIAISALDEVGKALSDEFGFSEREMAEWNDTVIRRIKNPALKDSVERIGADPVRKLRDGDRLIGAAKLALKHGIKPVNILKGTAAGFLFNNRDDVKAKEIQELIHKDGIDKAIKEISGLSWKKGSDDYYMIERIKNFYYGFKIGSRAYNLGFSYERDYHGCGQCALGAILDAFEYEADDVFKATTAFAGGIGEMCDGSCGGYIAGILVMGLAIGRKKSHFAGDREEKYKTAELARALRERFIVKYGSVTCRDIHSSVFGRTFDLSLDEDRKIFDKMGAHDTKCTTVVADASRWTVEILFEILGKEYLEREFLKGKLPVF